MIPLCVQWDKQNTQINGGEMALRNNPDRFQLKIHDNAASVLLTGRYLLKSNWICVQISVQFLKNRIQKVEK